MQSYTVYKVKHSVNKTTSLPHLFNSFWVLSFFFTPNLALKIYRKMVIVNDMLFISNVFSERIQRYKSLTVNLSKVAALFCIFSYFHNLLYF